MIALGTTKRCLGTGGAAPFAQVTDDVLEIVNRQALFQVHPV